MSRAAILAIDLGTSAVKALLLDATGRSLSAGSAEVPIERPAPDRAEQEPAAWWAGTVAATRAALSAAPPGTEIAAVGLTGQMHGTVLLDAADQPVGPAIIWPDQRSARQVAELTERVGAERLIELAGSPLATGFQAASLRWLIEHEPDRWARVKRVLTPKDALRLRLTGEAASDPSDGSGTLLLDVRRRDWSPELLAAVGVELERLPPVRPSASVGGHLRPEAAAELGVPAGLPVAVGGGDAPCAALGAGIVDPGRLLLTFSTGAQVLVPQPTVVVDRRGRLHTFCAALEPAPDQAGWYTMGATLVAGLALRWLRDRVFALPEADAYTRMTAWAAEAPPGARGLIFLPYLVGERSPHMDPFARGMFLGLTAGHGRAELVRAVLEGVTLAAYDAFGALRELGASPAEIVVAGGGARSALWPRIVADVFGLPVRTLAVADQSAVGAALLAGGSIGRWQPAAQARAWARYGPPLAPDPASHARYAELFPIFRAAYAKHRVDFRALAALGA